MDKQDQISGLNKATEQHKQRQLESLTIDINQAIRERDSKPITVKFDGNVYELPSEPPAWILDLVEKSKEVGDEQNLWVIKKLLGDDLWAEIINSDNNVSLSLINDAVLVPVFRHWGLEINDETESGKGMKLNS